MHVRIVAVAVTLLVAVSVASALVFPDEDTRKPRFDDEEIRPDGEDNDFGTKWGRGWRAPDDGETWVEKLKVPGYKTDPRAFQIFAQKVVAKVGNPIVIPNPFRWNWKDWMLFNDFCDNIDAVIRLLRETARWIKNEGKPTNGAAVGDLLEFVMSIRDSVRAVKNFIDVQKARQLWGKGQPDCRDLWVNDEGAPRVLEAGEGSCDFFTDERISHDFTPAGLNKVRSVGLHGHLIPLPRWGTAHKPHERIATASADQGGFVAILKEFFGLKVRLSYTWVPIWQEAWYSRRRIIGYRKVIKLNLVPCEYLKSIVYEKRGDSGIVTPKVSAQEWCDHGLLSFWRFF